MLQQCLQRPWPLAATLLAAILSGCGEQADDSRDADAASAVDASNQSGIVAAAGTFRLDKQAMREAAERRIRESGQRPEDGGFGVAIALIDQFDITLRLLPNGAAEFTTKTPDGAEDVSKGSWEVSGNVITVSPSPESGEPPASGQLDGDVLTLDIPGQPDAFGMIFRKSAGPDQ